MDTKSCSFLPEDSFDAIRDEYWKSEVFLSVIEMNVFVSIIILIKLKQNDKCLIIRYFLSVLT